MSFLVVRSSRFASFARRASGQAVKRTTKTLANLRVLANRRIDSFVRDYDRRNIYTPLTAPAELPAIRPERCRGKSIHYSAIFICRYRLAHDATDAIRRVFEINVLTPTVRPPRVWRRWWQATGEKPA